MCNHCCYTLQNEYNTRNPCDINCASGMYIVSRVNLHTYSCINCQQLTHENTTTNQLKTAVHSQLIGVNISSHVIASLQLCLYINMGSMSLCTQYTSTQYVHQWRYYPVRISSMCTPLHPIHRSCKVCCKTYNSTTECVKRTGVLHSCTIILCIIAIIRKTYLFGDRLALRVRLKVTSWKQKHLLVIEWYLYFHM